MPDVRARSCPSCRGIGPNPGCKDSWHLVDPAQTWSTATTIDPTNVAAYEAACRALEKHRARADAAEGQRDALAGERDAAVARIVELEATVAGQHTQLAGANDAYRRQCIALCAAEAEIVRLRKVVEPAQVWRLNVSGSVLGSHEMPLRDAVDEFQLGAAASGDVTDEQTPGPAGEPRPWEELRSSGLLWLINRVVFHPRGWAFALCYRGGVVTGWDLQGDGGEVWHFKDSTEDDRFAAAQATLTPAGAVAALSETNGRAGVALSALAALVHLKDGPRDDDYRRRKDAAWGRARWVAFGFEANPSPSQPEPVPDSADGVGEQGEAQGARDGICGDRAEGLMGGPSMICDLSHGHSGWHGAEQPGTSRVSWMPREQISGSSIHSEGGSGRDEVIENAQVAEEEAPAFFLDAHDMAAVLANDRQMADQPQRAEIADPAVEQQEAAAGRVPCDQVKSRATRYRCSRDADHDGPHSGGGYEWGVGIDFGCPKCQTILNAKAANCDGAWHADNAPADPLWLEEAIETAHQSVTEHGTVESGIRAALPLITGGVLEEAAVLVLTDEEVLSGHHDPGCTCFMDGVEAAGRRLREARQVTS